MIILNQLLRLDSKDLINLKMKFVIIEEGTNYEYSKL